MAMPSQESHLPKGSGELAWALGPNLDERPEASKALPHPIALFLCSGSELRVIPLPPAAPSITSFPSHREHLGPPLLFSSL